MRFVVFQNRLGIHFLRYILSLILSHDFYIFAVDIGHYLKKHYRTVFLIVCFAWLFFGHCLVDVHCDRSHDHMHKYHILLHFSIHPFSMFWKEVRLFSQIDVILF